MKRLILCLACATSLMACTKKMTTAKVPQNVQQSFTQKFPGATDAEWEQESNGEFEVAFKGTDGRHTANFSATGTWMETETEIPVEKLPAAAKTYLAGKKIKEAAQLQMADGSTVYEAEVSGTDYLFNEAGQFLRVQKD